jgi:hypothetical protein
VRRRLFTITCAASLALLLAAVAVWVRSYYAADSLTALRRFGDPDAPGHGYSYRSVHWSMGTISQGGGTVLDRLPPDDRRLAWSSFPASQLARPTSPWLNFRFSYSGQPQRVAGWSRGTILRSWRFTMPCWTLALTASALPAWWTAQRLTYRTRARRLTRGLCGRCGYDLTGNASGVCPECGSPKA